MMMAVSHQEQFALRIRLRDEGRFANFFEGRNAGICERLESWLASADASPLVLCGDQGAGKSHLLNGLCLLSEQRAMSSLYLSLGEAAALEPQALEGFEQFDLICLDELDALPPRPEWEESLLHLFNRVVDCGRHLLIAARTPPHGRDWQLADLASRLRALPVVQLAMPRDEERQAMLTARAQSRGLQLGDEVAAFILKRAPRDTGALLALLDRLDEASLQHQRRLTVPFVKHILGW